MSSHWTGQKEKKKKTKNKQNRLIVDQFGRDTFKANVQVAEYLSPKISIVFVKCVWEESKK